MLEHESLSNLSQYRSNDAPVISLYLRVDREAPDDKHLIHLKNLAAQTEEHKERYSHEGWQQLQADLARIREWVRDNSETVRGGEGLALFSCGDDLWQSFSVPYELPTGITLSDRPRLRPLYRLLQRFERYLAILTDARDARVFMVTPDGAREVAQVEDDTPGRHDQGGWSQARFQRHQDKMVEEHLDHAATRAFALFQNEGFDGLVLLGTDERTSSLLDHLHPYLRQRVLARQPMDMEATAQQVGDSTLAVAREQRWARHGEQLAQWEGAIKGSTGLGTGGLAETLRAAQQKQLMVLLMREDLVAEGGACKQCGALTDLADGACEYCGGPLQHFDDVTEALTAAAMEQGAELLFLASENGARHLDNYGGVGAILRYAIATS